MLQERESKAKHEADNERLRLEAEEELKRRAEEKENEAKQKRKAQVLPCRVTTVQLPAMTVTVVMILFFVQELQDAKVAAEVEKREAMDTAARSKKVHLRRMTVG